MERGSRTEKTNRTYDEIENYELAMDILTDINTPQVYKLVARCIEVRVNSIRHENTILRSALNEARKEKDKLTKDNEELINRLTAMENTINDKTALLEEADVDYEQLLNECNAVKVKLAKTVEDNDNFYKINKQLKDENSRLTNRVAEYMDELKSKNAEIAALKEVVNTYRDEYYKYSEGLVTQYDKK